MKSHSWKKLKCLNSHEIITCNVGLLVKLYYSKSCDLIYWNFLSSLLKSGLMCISTMCVYIKDQTLSTAIFGANSYWMQVKTVFFCLHIKAKAGMIFESLLILCQLRERKFSVSILKCHFIIYTWNLHCQFSIKI